jgi:hypothetical protein
MGCPGSIRATAHLGRSKSNAAARLGTAAHALGEHRLNQLDVVLERQGHEAALALDWSAQSLRGCLVCLNAEDDGVVVARSDRHMIPPGYDDAVYPVDDVMLYGVDLYLATIRDELERLGPGTQMVIERRFDLSWVYEGREIPDYARELFDPRTGAPCRGGPLELFGTNDCCLVQPFGEIVVVDYKNGRVPVEVEGNTQVLYYGLGAARTLAALDFTTLKMVIVQPNCVHQDGAVRDWSVSREFLLGWRVELADAALRTADPEAPLRGGDHCTWCEVRGTCRAFRDATFLEAQADFDDATGDVSVPEATRMSDEDLALALRTLPMLRAYASAVEAEAQRRLFAGSVIPGLKLVRKKTNRAFPAVVRVPVGEIETIVDADTEDAGEVEVPLENYLERHVLAIGLDEADLYTRKLKTPAQVEKLGSTPEQRKAMRALVKDLAFKPEGGVVVAKEEDPRPAIDWASVAADDFEEFEEGDGGPA